MPTETLTSATAEIENPIDIAVNEVIKALKCLSHHGNNKAARSTFKEAVDKVALLGAINKTMEKNNTLLHLAIKRSSLFAVKCLLARGANISLQNEAGDAALHIAAKLGHLEIIEEMLGVSAAAKFRTAKKEWRDKDRKRKSTDLESSQKKAWGLLDKPNQQNELPLVTAAKLQDDRIYKRLLELSPQYYSKKLLDEGLEIRKKRIKNLKLISGGWAFLATLCPSMLPSTLAGMVTIWPRLYLFLPCYYPRFYRLLAELRYFSPLLDLLIITKISLKKMRLLN